MSHRVRGILLSLVCVSFLATAVPAADAAGCTDGSRSQAAAFATMGGLSERSVAWVDGDDVFVVKLRYSSVTRCAWGWVGLAQSRGAFADGYVWLDRSYDGGRTWQGVLGFRHLYGYNGRAGAQPRSTYTGAYDDAGALMRACGYSNNARQPHCSTWF